MNYKDEKDIQRTNDWFAINGIGVNQIYVGTAEMFQAQMLATNTLKQHGHLLDHMQATTLNNFLRSANGKQRSKITQGLCFKVMNITKQVIRKSARLMKQKPQAHIKAKNE